MGIFDIDSFYRNMEYIIDKREIPLKEIYSAIGMGQSNFSSAYRRKNGRHFSVEQMLAITEYLNCSLDYMFRKSHNESDGRIIQIPEMSKWTCADLLELVFLLRKSEGGCRFVNTKAINEPFNDEVDVTAIYFSRKFDLKNVVSFSGENTEMLINTVIREWAKIIEGTSSLDEETRELILSTWEKGKKEQMENILLSDEHKTYDFDNNKNKYFEISYE